MHYHLATFGWDIGIRLWLHELGILVVFILVVILGYLGYQYSMNREVKGDISRKDK